MVLELNSTPMVVIVFLLKTFDVGTIKSLIKKEVLIEKEIETSRLLFDYKEKTQKKLSEFQTQTVTSIEESFETKQAVLLHGVTGSGKTEIYTELIQKVINQGKQVLYLVPEIALTSQLMMRFEEQFSFKPALWHSKISKKLKREIFFGIFLSKCTKNHRHFFSKSEFVLKYLSVYDPSFLKSSNLDQLIKIVL